MTKTACLPAPKPARIMLHLHKGPWNLGRDILQHTTLCRFWVIICTYYIIDIRRGWIQRWQNATISLGEGVKIKRRIQQVFFSLIVLYVVRAPKFVAAQGYRACDSISACKIQRFQKVSGFIMLYLCGNTVKKQYDYDDIHTAIYFIWSYLFYLSVKILCVGKQSMKKLRCPTDASNMPATLKVCKCLQWCSLFSSQLLSCHGWNWGL